MHFYHGHFCRRSLAAVEWLRAGGTDRAGIVGARTMGDASTRKARLLAGLKRILHCKRDITYLIIFLPI
jgi:hypothetical protein